MTRTLEETRSRSWAAAAVEPAELEPDGTTVTRIAARAGVDEVLTEAVEELSSAVALEGLRFDDLGESAGRTLDHYRQHPELARSLQWQGLRGAPPVRATARVAHHRRRIGATAHVQPDGVIDSRIDDLAGADADAHGRLGAGGPATVTVAPRSLPASCEPRATSCVDGSAVSPSTRATTTSLLPLPPTAAEPPLEHAERAGTATMAWPERPGLGWEGLT